MSVPEWSQREKQIARNAFESARQRELAELLANFKAQAASATVPEDMWVISDLLNEAQRKLAAKYDFRYSHVLAVFGRLLQEGRVTEEELAGLSGDKLELVRKAAAFSRG